METIILHTLADTEALAKKIVTSLKGGEVIALSGDLGSGKTTFTQFLASALGVKGVVNSPTFVIMKIYEVHQHPIRHLAHMDAYRLGSASEVSDLGVEEFLGNPSAVVVVEWAEKIGTALEKYKPIRLSFSTKDDVRQVTVDGL